MFDVFEKLNILYWGNMEKEVVKKDDRKDQTTILARIKEINNILNEIKLFDSTDVLNDVKGWIEYLESNYEHDEEIFVEDVSKLYNSSEKWKAEVKKQILARIESYKDFSNVYDELRSLREMVYYIPKLEERLQKLVETRDTDSRENIVLNEIFNKMKSIESSNIELIVSSPNQRTFEPKMRSLIDSTKHGPVYIAGYVDQNMIKELIEFAKRVDLNIISPELKITEQDKSYLEALQTLSTSGARIKIHSMLNARFVSTANEALVGSADLIRDSFRGLRYDLSIRSNNPFIVEDLSKFAETVWTEARPLFNEQRLQN
jgi:hypothetical protein